MSLLGLVKVITSAGIKRTTRVGKFAPPEIQSTILDNAGRISSDELGKAGA